MANWGTRLARDLGREAPINNKAVGVRTIIQEVMDKDEMCLLDPMGSDFNFRVRVLVFYNPPPADINGGRIHDLHNMDHDLIESRLQLQFIATKQGSAVAKNIQEATAHVVSHHVDDITVVDTILAKAHKHIRSSKDVVFLSIAMWMHRPRGYYL